MYFYFGRINSRQQKEIKKSNLAQILSSLPKLENLVAKIWSLITQKTKNYNKFTRGTSFKIQLSDCWPFKLTLKSWDLNENYFFANVLYLVKTPHVDSSIMGNALISIIERIISSHRNSRGRPCKSNCCWFSCWTAWWFSISFWSNICNILLSRIKNDPKQTLKIQTKCVMLPYFW